jgi:hypothetical protein
MVVARFPLPVRENRASPISPLGMLLPVLGADSRGTAFGKPCG